jgi:hypothetical protein
MAVPAISLDWERVRSTLPEALQARVQNARELLRRRAEIHREAPLPTGLMSLDRLLGGGLERGALTELAGHRSSGRFAVALQALAAATQGGEPAALVDLGGQLDPAAAAAVGCDLERLLWARADHLRLALAAAETLLQAGFPLVVLDLGPPPVPGGRGQEAAWTRLARAAEAQHAVLLVSAPYRASGTAAATVLTTRAARTTWHGKGKEPRLLAGLRTSVTLQKSRLQSDEQRTCELRWTVALDEASTHVARDARGARDPRLLDSATLHPPALPGKGRAAEASSRDPRSAELATGASPPAPGRGAANLKEAEERDEPRELAPDDSPISPLPEMAGGRRQRESRRPRTSHERYEIERLRN